MDEELKAHLEAMEGRLMSKMSMLVEGLHTAINGIHDDITVLGGANDRVRKHSENTRDEARDIADSLATIERTLRKHGTRLDDLDRRLSRKPDGE